MDLKRRFGLAARLVGTALVLAAAVALVWATSAPAEPYFAVRDGYKCSKCHVNRTGGGMRTDYAKVYMETRASMYPGFAPAANAQNEPKADYAHGRLSPYFSLSADLRADLTYTKQDQAQGTWEFNRGATDSACAACHTQSTSGGSKRAELYARAEVLPDVASLVVSQSFLPATGPREVYAVLDVLPANGYVKAGSFRLPTGMNVTWDEPFVHINQSLGGKVPTLETVRAQGVEFGIEPGPFAVSLSVTNPIDMDKAKISKRVLVNGYAAGSLGLLGLIAYQDPIDVGLKRKLTGLYGGVNVGRITALGELDRLTTESDTTDTKSASVMGELDFLITRGQNLKFLYESFDPSSDVQNDRRDRISLIYEPIVTPYLQLRAGTRTYRGPSQTSPTAADKNNGRQFFMELHVVY
jgi:hypothetical protein